ncbi:hypothetical protein TRIP_C90100 [Candidatus Zixiibacteriota bacterium]|nr:hypothetical protein TRIP_C90100 [candidate division Zixibacteria bacterium]
MVKEITKNSWPKFFRTFNSANLYRLADISIIDKNESSNRVASNLTFLGLGLEKKGRLIDSLRFFAGSWNPEKPAESFLAVRQPSKIFVEKDDRGFDRTVRVQAKDGTEAIMHLSGDSRPEPLVEKVAYSIYEKRGRSDGNDMGDWLQAEKIVKKTQESLI